MRRISLALLLVVMSVMLSVVTASASATVVKSTFEISQVGTQWQGCDEVVEITNGVSVVDEITVVHENGRINHSLHAQLRDIEGVGLVTGQRYFLRGSHSEGFLNGSAGEIRNGFIESHIVLHSPGNSSTLIVRTKSHFTIDPSGNIHVSYFESESKCR